MEKAFEYAFPFTLPRDSWEKTGLASKKWHLEVFQKTMVLAHEKSIIRLHDSRDNTKQWQRADFFPL